MFRTAKFIKMIAVLALAIMFLIPDSLSFSSPVKAQAASISVTKVVLKPGKTKKITVEGDGTGFTWTSSNTAVAKAVKKVKADNTATITAKGEGVAVITATKGKTVYTCSVVVMADADTKAPEGEKATTSKSFKDITVFEKEGTVSITRSKKSLSATKNMKLKNNDFATVEDDSFLRLCMDDKSYTYFESGSEFAISKGWFSKIKVCMTKGEMIVEVQKKLDNNDSIDIVTPNTSMSIRGTVAAVKTIPGKDGKTTTINYVLEGSAEVTYKDKKTKDNKVVKLNAGEGWETTTNKKGKVVENKKADASKFDFENIDINKLQGADGGKMIVIGKDIPEDTGKDDRSETGSENSGSGESTDNAGTGTNDSTDSDNNTDTGSDTGNENIDTSPVFINAVPAVFDYDRTNVAIAEEKEDFPNDNTMVIKEYDVYGVLRHKSQSVESFNENQSVNVKSESREYTNADSYYDSNGVLRIYRTERTVFTYSDNMDSERSYVNETYYNADKTVIFEYITDDTHETTKWYTDDGKLAEYLVISLEDNKEVEHIYYAYDQNGNRKVVE